MLELSVLDANGVGGRWRRRWQLIKMDGAATVGIGGEQHGRVLALLVSVD